MTSREQFEAEMAKLGDIVDMRRAKNGDMEYMAWDVALAWKMWQASREAVEIELPALSDPADCYCDVYTTAGVISALRTAGVKVKGE